MRKFLILPIVAIASMLGCEVASVHGDRASSGECPFDVCSESTPDGLIFYGRQMFDDDVDASDRLGPVAVGGTFSVSFSAQGADMPDYTVSFEGGDAEVVSQSSHGFTFRALGEGDLGVVLKEAGTKGVMDRFHVSAGELTEVAVKEAKWDREALHAGCHEWVGIELSTELGRSFDMDVDLVIDGVAVPEMWDCYSVDVPEDVSSLEVVVITNGEEFVLELPVVQGACSS